MLSMVVDVEYSCFLCTLFLAFLDYFISLRHTRTSISSEFCMHEYAAQNTRITLKAHCMEFSVMRVCVETFFISF